jgi:protein import protein ZIM17
MTWPSARATRSVSAALQTRNLSTEEEPAQRPLTDRTQADKVSQDQTDAEAIAARKAAAPAYQLWITCKKCLERSSHTISKQAYHFGSCVVQCPKCKSQHLISDNLKVSVTSPGANVVVTRLFLVMLIFPPLLF